MNKIYPFFLALPIAIPAFAEVNLPIIDDFTHPQNTHAGIERIMMTDAVIGGNSVIELELGEGDLHLKGEIQPPRGQLGWVSMTLPLIMEGKTLDVSDYHGVRLLIKIDSGNVSVSVNSSEVKNFDYHAAPVILDNMNAYQEVKVPFTLMKRTWSGLNALNAEAVHSVSLIAYSSKSSVFNLRIDEVSFY